MKTVQIQTNLFRVAIHAGKFTEYTAQNRLVTQPDDAEFYDEDDADILVEKYQELYPNANVVKEPVIEEMPIDDFCQAIADFYNTMVSGWDHQHSSNVRDENVAEFITELECHQFQAEDIEKHIADYLHFEDGAKTIREAAIGLADMVAQKLVSNPYGDVTFHINPKN